MDTIFNGKGWGLAGAAAAALAINLAMAAGLGHLPTRGQQWLATAAGAEAVRLAAVHVRPVIDPAMTLVKDMPSPTQRAPIHLARLLTCGTGREGRAHLHRARQRAR